MTPLQQKVLAGLKDHCREKLTKESGMRDYHRERVATDHEAKRNGEVAVCGAGSLTCELSRYLGMAQADVRRVLLQLERQGKTMREHPSRRLSAHRWWPVGFTDELFADGTMKPMVKCDGCFAATRSCYGCMGECQLEKRDEAEKTETLVDCGQCPRSCGCVGSCMKGDSK